jgi:hypothetical protein
MKQIADGFWYDTAPVRIVGAALSVNMVALRLPSGGLLIHSPLAMTPERRAGVEALGPIEHLVAPNLFHHLSRRLGRRVSESEGARHDKTERVRTGRVWWVR